MKTSHIQPTRHRRLNLWTFDETGIWTDLEHGRCYIDADVWPWAKRFFWYSEKSMKGYYVLAWAWENGVKRRIRMHRVIAVTPPDKVTDHRDGNTFNNRRANLRVCTQTENIFNREMPANQIGIRGLHVRKTAKSVRVVAEISKDGKRYKKHFKRKEDAETWYMDMLGKLHGDFAYINRPVAA